MATCVLIVEDHPLFREGATQLLRALVPDTKVMGAATAEEGLALAATARPDLVLLDLALPGMEGAAAVARFAQALPGVPVVALSGSEDRHDVQTALRAGAVAFVSKTASGPVLIETLRRVLAGQSVDSPWVQGEAGLVPEGGGPQLPLTGRQEEILLALCQGLSNKEIGLRLELSENTVKSHIAAIFKALRVINRTQAALKARRYGLVTAASPDRDAT